MDPSYSYATPEGDPLAEVPAHLRHTVTLKTERFDPLTYLNARFVYASPLTYTFTTAELVGQPLTFKQLVSGQNPPRGCLIYCWTHFTYIPYFRVGDNDWIVQGHPYWELLSDYPFGQSGFANTSAPPANQTTAAQRLTLGAYTRYTPGHWTEP